ncbi:TonB-dependent receptor [Anseongella ginsenosidimutans]|nr:TonB-dependent receptor [Anseongella ginsenosidimutans]
MKLIAVLLTVSIMQVSAGGFAQNLTFSQDDVSIKQIFKEIRKQTGYDVFYLPRMVDAGRRLQVNFDNAPLEQVMERCLEGYPLTYVIDDKTIVITRKLSFPRPEDFTTAEKAQQAVSGQVTDSIGAPLPGVAVQVKGTSTGSITDEEGRYELPALEDGAVLVFNLMGFFSQEIPVNGRGVIDLVMKVEESQLEEVVVVGYGTQKRTSLTSAVSDIKGEELTRRPVANAPQALQGLAPGVTVMDRGGAPGKSNATIRIRGITTLGANDPLVVVDGIEQSLQDLNPNDIASVTVLKDAASTAIYGSRAANGVVLVTTKRAETGTLSVNYNGYYAVQQSIYNPEHMGLEDFMRLENTGFVNAGKEPKYTETEIQEWVNATDRYKYPLPNVWFDVFLDPAPQQSHTLSLSGGTEQIKALFSVNYYKQDGIIPTSTGDRKDVRLNTDFKVSDRISLSGDFNYRVKEYAAPLHEDAAFRYMLSGSNFAVPVYPDGTYGLGSENYSPLVTAVMDGTSDFADNYAFINLKGNIEILKGLRFQTQYAVKYEQYYRKDFANDYEIRDYYNKDNILKSVGPNSLTEIRNNSKEYTLNNLLVYDANWSDHALNATLGYSQISHDASELSASRNDFYNNEIQAISQGSADSRDNDGLDFDWGLRSYFGRATYNYSGKYFLEASARYDGSSRFTGDNKYSFFPSVSGAWRISREPFWDGARSVVNEFKLRGSWGKTGNQAVDLYSYFETLAALNYNFGGNGVQGIIQQALANEALTWETTVQTDVGVDLEFLNGKFGLTFDYYVKNTEGILLDLPIPSVIGLTAPPQNAGVVENKGWEVSVTHQNDTHDFRYAITANVSDVRNKIVSLAGTGPYISGSPNEILTIRKEGLPIDAYIGYKTLGFFQSEEDVANYALFDPATSVGDVKYADINEDGAINSEDYVMIGSSIPRYTFGLNMNFGYKNFDMNVFFQGVGKVNGLPSGAFREQGNWGGFALAIGKDYWTPENRDAEFPRPKAQTIHNSQMSDFWMIDASYVKLKNLQIGYTLPASLTEKLTIRKLRVYVSGSNLFTISEATKWGLDPEFPSGRLNYYPQVSLYTLGLNVTF